MQSSRLFQRNNQKFRGLWPQGFAIGRHLGLSCVRCRIRNDSGTDCDSENSSSDECIKVTVIGAAGRVGRTLSLLLKTSPLVDHLCMFDIDKSVKGYSVDISHIDTKCCVKYVCGMRNIQEALDDPDVVVVTAGMPTSPKLQGKKLFKKNAPIVAGLSEAWARFCPQACIVLITNPINSLLPVAGEVYELVTGEKPTPRLFGLTTLDVVRANTFTAEAIRRDPSNVIVPVIGGTSADTIVPVISQMKPCCKIKHEEVVALTECVKQAEESLADCQNCGTRGSSSLSTAYAGFRFTSSLIAALKGGKDIIECAYVQSDILPELEYLASPIKLGKCGMEYNYGYPKLSDYEVSLMERAAPVLQSDVKIGKSYVIMQRGKHYEKRCRMIASNGGSVVTESDSFLFSDEEDEIAMDSCDDFDAKTLLHDSDDDEDTTDFSEFELSEDAIEEADRKRQNSVILDDDFWNGNVTEKLWLEKGLLTSPESSGQNCVVPCEILLRMCCPKESNKAYVNTEKDSPLKIDF